MPLVGVNHCQAILHICRRMVHICSTYDLINQFEIGYVINPSLHVNKGLREQIDKLLNATFHAKTMKNIKYDLKNKNTCVIEIIFFYNTK